MKTLILVLSQLFLLATAQIMNPAGIQVKITDTPFPVANAQALSQIKWTMLGTTARESIYCVSEAPVSQLRFVCVDCLERNITDMVNELNSAQDLTRTATYPTVALKNVAANTNWTGATIICQAAVSGGTVDSQPATVDVQFLRQPHVVDASGQGPVLIANQGYRFYVECVRNNNEALCQNGRRKTLKCAVQSHPPATQFRWLKNGQPTSGNGAEISIGTEMIGQSIQCQANNGLFSDLEMPTSQAVQIDPYTSATVLKTNFDQAQAMLRAGSRAKINDQVSLACHVEGNPRPVVFWRMRKSNGEVVDAACPQGFEGQYQDVSDRNPLSNVVRLNAGCTLRISNYSYAGQYWCSACSYVSQGSPECSPGLDAPGANQLTLQVEGPPMMSDTPPSIEQSQTSNNAVVTVHYCAEPMPMPPRDIQFEIDQNTILVGQSWENFKFESTTQNNSVPTCYFARLHIMPVKNDDQYRMIKLKLRNEGGSREIPVSLDALLGGGSASTGRVSILVILLVVLLGIIIFLVCCVAVIIKRRMLCFDKEDGSRYESKIDKNTKAKACWNSRDSFYEPDAPRLYNPPGESPYDLAVQAAFDTSDSRMSSV